MTKYENNNDFLNKERQDAQEFAEIVVRVPKEKKREVESLVNGFCLAANMYGMIGDEKKDSA